MGVIFISAIFVVPQISYINLLHLDQQQLRNVASQTLKAVLLQTGYPADWGTAEPFDPDSVERFGLAQSNSSSFYVLDPDKVQRLVSDNPLGYIEYSEMQELLGLEDYGFSISIIPPFNVTIQNEVFEFDDDNATIKLEVDVSSRNGLPIANAVVESTIIYSTTKSGNVASLYFIVDQNSTDSLGTCKVDKQISAPSGEEFSNIIVIFRVTVAEIATLVVTYQDTPPNDIAEINMVGDELILTMPNATPRGARWVDYVIKFDWESFVFLYNGTRSNDDKLTYGQGYKVWSKNFANLKRENPSLTLFGFWAVEPGGGRREVLIAGPNPNWLGSRVLHYGGMPTSSGSSVKVQRNVVISGMVYTIELTMWKETP
jgi:hypothetical protein